MNERIRTILEHMLEDAQDILTMAEGINDFEEFYQNMPIRKATVMSLLNIDGMSLTFLIFDLRQDDPTPARTLQTQHLAYTIKQTHI